jgi:antitoxin component HigA of HigAB toxin-antitoxin module
MEIKIQYNIDKFVAFLFGEKNECDEEQRIYNKLLRLEGEELETWMNEKVKKYIICAGFYVEFAGNEFEGIDGPTLFETWYNDNVDELIKLEEIYDRTIENYRLELYAIKIKLREWQQPNSRNYDRDLSWQIHIITDYMEMFIMEMSTADLKSYIIQQVDPVEIM